MKHVTVLKEESINGLNIKPEGVYVDATLGGGGHSLAILEQLTTGHLYCFDKDVYAIERAMERLSKYNNFTIINSSFFNLIDELAKLGVTSIDGILFDLGLSSFQIDDESRGFSYLTNNKLDMRMDQSQEISAHTLVNELELQELTDIFRNYGEERNAYQISKQIIKNRPINTTKDLVDITDRVNARQKGHSAKRVFQALRIAVNDEVNELKSVLRDAISILNPKGRIVVISFHSLEDRITKQTFRDYSIDKTPKGLIDFNAPKPILKLINRKPVIPTDLEIELNSRSRSAKLRVGERNDD